jgi:hypothetical protein
MQSANDALEQQGFGGGNFSVPLYANGGATYAGLHAWNDAPFVAAIKAITGVIWEESDGAPTTRFNALVNAQGVKWVGSAPNYPATGTITAGQMYRYTDGNVYQVIQPYDVGVFSAPPSTYPALIVMARDPYRAYEWYQTGQFDAFKLVNPFTKKPDECLLGGKKWKVTQADGSGNNTYQPDVFGWTEI